MCMKKIILLMIAIAGLQCVVVAGKPKIEFQETEYVITDNVLGETSDHVFVYKNVGDAPLVLANVVPSCGCVTPTWTKNPVAPGDTGSVHVYYQSRVSGAFHKTVKVYSNAGGKRPVLQISGETKKK